MIPIVLVGAAGRMGRAIAAAAADDPTLGVRMCIDRAENFSGLPGVWSDDLDVISPGDVVIEFSVPEACRETARRCGERGAALVSGTTGLAPGDEAVLRAAAERVPVLRASNFSLGVAVLTRALQSALAVLPAGWDVEIVERHHRRKVDSPSGTALALARVAAETRGTPGASVRSGREGRVGPRPEEEIGVHAVRGGTWVGDHTVLLAGEGEWLELRHVAQDRAAFAHGAIAAARFVATAAPGFHALDSLFVAR